jgi:hypothetical protein
VDAVKKQYLIVKITTYMDTYIRVHAQPVRLETQSLARRIVLAEMAWFVRRIFFVANVVKFAWMVKYIISKKKNLSFKEFLNQTLFYSKIYFKD